MINIGMAFRTMFVLWDRTVRFLSIYMKNNYGKPYIWKVFLNMMGSRFNVFGHTICFQLNGKPFQCSGKSYHVRAACQCKTSPARTIRIRMGSISKVIHTTSLGKLFQVLQHVVSWTNYQIQPIHQIASLYFFNFLPIVFTDNERVSWLLIHGFIILYIHRLCRRQLKNKILQLRFSIKIFTSTTFSVCTL